MPCPFQLFDRVRTIREDLGMVSFRSDRFGEWAPQIVPNSQAIEDRLEIKTRLPTQLFSCTPIDVALPSHVPGLHGLDG